MITLTASQQEILARHSDRTWFFENRKHPEIVSENFKTNAAWLTDRYKLYMPRLSTVTSPPR